MSGSADLDDIGRARRVVRDGVELWQTDDARLAERLVSLGEAGVGGFYARASAAGEEDGPWIARRTPAPTLEDLAKDSALPWREALPIARDLALALEACERAGLFPGPLRPDQIVLDPSGAWFAAEPLVRAIVGGGDTGRSSSAGARWTPPEQAAGDPWDGAANRYVLGLVLYRLIAGALPFGGAGMRHAFEEQRAGPPPFEDAIARELRPGVQAFVLRLLDPSREARPRDAGAIAKACEELLSEARTQMPIVKSPVPVPVPGSVGGLRRSLSGTVTGTRTGVSVKGAPAWLPILVGALVACFALLARATREGAPLPTTIVPPVVPLRSASAAECAPCHAREVAEWERSVMAHSVKSPLFGALESLVEEQVGKDFECPNGAGILRPPGADSCRARATGIVVTGSGGERWCVNCHSPGDNLDHTLAPWSATGSKRGRAPASSLLSPLAMEGISCASCHETVGPVASHARGGRRAYEGNATWLSAATGQVFLARPEDDQGRPGIANSGYALDPGALLGATLGATRAGDGPLLVHRRPPGSAASYLRSSEFCGACHDVRLFGSDVLGARDHGEHFKRLRNAYSEWRTWSDDEARRGRKAPGCQGCHMSLYPGVCAPGGSGTGSECPPGTHFESRVPGQTPRGLVAPSSSAPSSIASHYFTSVDIPLTESLADALVDDATLDADGQPVGLRQRRDLLLRHTFRFAIGDAKRRGDALEIPVEIENTGAGHRVPAGFSQERETWVEMTVRDTRGGVVYEVGNVDAARGGVRAGEPADLRDKVFLRITTDDSVLDARGRPLGLFGADVIDGPDVPRWSPNPSLGGTRFRGKGLINLQNGFLRCVRCIGQIDETGACKPGPGQGATRADRFDDGDYDPDTGACRSNLQGGNELFETYFPVGALDAERGLAKAPDAIIDTRSAPPGVPLTYTYAIDASGHSGPFSVEARLRFRSFPPYLVRAFAAYEASKAAQGLRPGGPQVVPRMLRRIETVDLASARVTIP